MSTNKIYYAKPSISELEISYVTDAIKNGWGDNCYDYIYQFENLFREYTSSKHALATSSATGALHLGLAALGIGPGDEIILADTNWIASVAPVVHLGAKPVFVDILPDTWCLDPVKVEEAITSRTKAIIAVHLYGNLCDMNKLETIAKQHNLFIIEDAAEAIGSNWDGRVAGSRGIFGFYSFHGTKTVTTGEGGMLVTDNKQLYEKVSMLNNHGREKNEKKQFWASDVGYKFKMSNLQAAIGCAQMKRIESLIQRRREIFFLYNELLEPLHGLRMNPIPQGNEKYGYWMPTLIFPDPKIRDLVLEDFQKRNIDGRIFFHPLSSLTMFKKCKQNTICYDLAPRGLNLPSYHDLTTNDIEMCCSIINKRYTAKVI